MNSITSYFLAWLDREAAEQRMNEASDDAILELLTLKPEGGRLPLNDTHSIELAIVPKYNLAHKKGWQALLWRAWAATLVKLNKQVSEAIANLRKYGEAYAEEHEDYEPEWTLVLKVINLQKENPIKESNKEN